MVQELNLFVFKSNLKFFLKYIMPFVTSSFIFFCRNKMPALGFAALTWQLRNRFWSQEMKAKSKHDGFLI